MGLLLALYWFVHCSWVFITNPWISGAGESSKYDLTSWGSGMWMVIISTKKVVVWLEEGIDNCAAAYFAFQIMQVNMKAILLLLGTSDLVLYMPHSFLPRSGLLRRNTWITLKMHLFHWQSCCVALQKINLLDCFFSQNLVSGERCAAIYLHLCAHMVTDKDTSYFAMSLLTCCYPTINQPQRFYR